MTKLLLFFGNNKKFPAPFVRKSGLIVLFATIFVLSAFAQQVEIKGKVLEEGTKAPVIGSVIRIKGQKSATTSDANGSFSLKVKSLPVTLSVSTVGFKVQEVDVYEYTEPITVALTEDQNRLSSVVVVGYGTQKRSDFTGSLSSIPAELKGLPVTSPDLLLQGAVSGIQVTQSSGQPGSGATIQVRGSTSINAGTEPLYVIDGFPVYNGDASVNAGVTSGPKVNPLSGLNSADIESIDVLKDASATAIYGSRGANGVILITTKKAKKNESSVSYDGYYGVQTVTKKIDLLNAGEWASLTNDALASAGKPALYTQDQINQFGAGTDWQAAAFRQAAIQSHTLSISTGTEKSRILFSGNYFNQDGVIINTGFNRYSGRLNIDEDVTKRLKIGLYLNGSLTHANVAPSGIIQNLLSIVPLVSVRNADGTFTSNSSYGSTVANPIATLSQEINETKTSRFLLNGFAEYKILEGLTAKVLLGTDIVNNKQNQYLPATLYESSPGGQASIGSLSTINWLNENTLNYKKVFNQKHSFDILIGNTQQKSNTEIFTAGSSNFLTDLNTFNNLSPGSTVTIPTSFASQWVLQSYLGRINYGYDERYFLTLTARADGSSRFGGKNKWGTFPSAAIAWNATKENFIKNIKQISLLKVRFSGGLTGNQEIAPYSSLSKLSSYPTVIGNTIVYGLSPSSYADENLTWEKTTQFDLGLDLNLFSDRIQLTSDIYTKQTNDLFLEVPVPYSSGLNSIFQNCGSVENKGIELGLKTVNLTGKFEWTTNFTYSVNRNKVLSLGGVDNFIPIDPSNVTMPSQIVKVGQPLGSFYGYLTDGLNTNGSQKYKDLNNDKAISQDGDRALLGSSQPDFLASITNTFRYKNFDLSIFLNSSYGNKIYNRTRANLDLGSGYTGSIGDLRNRWTPTNTTATVHRAELASAVVLSDRYIEDGSYLRLKNISLGYTFSKKLLSKVKIKSARIYVSGQNLVTWTKYTGYDPEVSSNGQNAVSSGNDTGAYPTSKTVLGGLSLTF